MTAITDTQSIKQRLTETGHEVYYVKVYNHRDHADIVAITSDGELRMDEIDTDSLETTDVHYYAFDVFSKLTNEGEVTLVDEKDMARAIADELYEEDARAYRKELEEMTDKDLSEIYTNQIGHNPFEEGNSRSEVINILVEYSELQVTETEFKLFSVDENAPCGIEAIKKDNEDFSEQWEQELNTLQVGESTFLELTEVKRLG